MSARAARRLASAAPLAVAALAIGSAGCSKRDAGAADAGPADAGAVTTPSGDAGAADTSALPSADVQRLLNPDALPAYTGPTGSIEGTIFVTGARAPETPVAGKACPDAAKTFGRAFREGAPSAERGPRWLADAVVVVTGYSDFFLPEKREAVELTIEGCAFSRRTVTMTFGQRLEVKNLSTELWTPRLAPDSVPLVTMALPNGAPAKLHPKKPGRYRVYDHDRGYASADVFTFLHPLHATSGVEGTYRIDGVPVGKLTVSTMHPKIKGAEASQHIEVREGEVHRVDLTLDHASDEPGRPDAGVAPLRLR